MSVGYIADACALIPFLARHPMPRAVVEIMQNAEAAVSPVTVWEITRKAALGLLPITWSEAGLAAHLRAEGFPPLPLTWDDAEAANLLPPHHKDPMDRMLIAQARLRGLTILTSDRIFSAYDVRVLW